MKIRIKGNSVRVRLTRSEVDALAATGRLQETTEFGNSTFTYALQGREGITGLEAAFGNGIMTMYVPAHLPQPWAATETVGYSNNMPLPGGSTLYLLLEKDFKCIDAPAHEDQSDNFEHPTLSC